MLEKRKGYIDQLLKDLRLMEERVLSVRSNDSLPFSFFRESFDKIQEVSRTLHLLEFLQIDDMRGQMERLVHFLSEAESKDARQEPAAMEQGEEKETLSSSAPADAEETRYSQPVPAHGADDVKTASEEVKEVDREEGRETGNQHPRGIVLPEYRNPKTGGKDFAAERMLPEKEELPLLDPAPSEKKPAIAGPAFVEGKRASLNDIMPTRPSMVDLKRGISLNDRFLFQRELFGNNRQEMDRTMQALSKLASYKEAEEQLRESRSWDFESSTVSDFLQAIKQGFE